MESCSSLLTFCHLLTIPSPFHSKSLNLVLFYSVRETSWAAEGYMQITQSIKSPIMWQHAGRSLGDVSTISAFDVSISFVLKEIPIQSFEWNCFSLGISLRKRIRFRIRISKRICRFKYRIRIRTSIRTTIETFWNRWISNISGCPWSLPVMSLQ